MCGAVYTLCAPLVIGRRVAPRANDFLASLEMAPGGGVWMPARMTLAADITTARGEIDVTVTQRFFEYREAETGARLVDPAGFR